MIERRSILKCLVGLVAAPAIIKVSSLMPVNAALQPGVLYRLGWNYNTDTGLWTEVVSASATGNSWSDADFVVNNGPSMISQFAADRTYFEGMQWSDSKIGDMLRIRLPDDYVVSDAFQYATLNADGTPWRARQNRVPQIPAPLALVAAAVAVAPKVFATPVTRRFWSK